MAARAILFLFVWMGLGLPAMAERQSLFPLGAARSSAVLQGVPVQRGLGAPSLFAGTQGGSLFAPLPARQGGVPALTGSTQIDRLLSLIASAEAGPAGYDAVQYGARVRPAKRPTQMTLGEIYQWIRDTPGQPHAIGRYQFIPDTLIRLAEMRGMGPDTRFTPQVQDELAMRLLQDAGLRAFQAGEMERETFMRNLARIWAGLPLPDGRSHYHGYAGNRASISWDTFEAGMARIFPAAG